MPARAGKFSSASQTARRQRVERIPRNHYSVENFSHPPHGDKASQTQAIGINQNSEFPKVVGFYTDNNTGFTHGFLDFMGTQTTVDDPQGNS